MPKINDMFPSKYVTGVELHSPVTVTVKHIEAERVYKPGAGEVTVFVLYTQEGKRGVILSRPMARQIAQALGSDDTDHWIGKKIILYPQPMTVAGIERVAIRARSVTEKAA